MRTKKNINEILGKEGETINFPLSFIVVPNGPDLSSREKRMFVGDYSLHSGEEGGAVIAIEGSGAIFVNHNTVMPDVFSLVSDGFTLEESEFILDFASRLNKRIIGPHKAHKQKPAQKSIQGASHKTNE